jgi:hypothetical protein
VVELFATEHKDKNKNKIIKALNSNLDPDIEKLNLIKELDAMIYEILTHQEIRVDIKTRISNFFDNVRVFFVWKTPDRVKWAALFISLWMLIISTLIRAFV